ncbi:glycogen operon protein, partial [Streptomyces sp. OspMP-M43]
MSSAAEQEAVQDPEAAAGAAVAEAGRAGATRPGG